MAIEIVIAVEAIPDFPGEAIVFVVVVVQGEGDGLAAAILQALTRLRVLGVQVCVARREGPAVIERMGEQCLEALHLRFVPIHVAIPGGLPRRIN